MADKKLSLCMIVKNEAHQLGELLDQVKDAVDEIIIVDTGSEDNTVEVARNYTPFVFSFPWQDDFSAARNFALDHAHGDYFLWLDADDRLPKNSVKKLELLKKYFDGETFFLFILEDFKKEEVHSRFYQVRCAPLRKNIRFRYRIHEELLSSLTEAGYKGATTDIVIRHHGYDDPDILRLKMERNLRLLLKDFDLRHHNADYTLLLANSYIYFERFDEAASVLRNYIEKYSFNTGSKIALGEIYQLLGYMEAIRNNKAEAIRWLVKAEAVEELGKAELYKLGCLYESMGELGRALRSFQLALRATYIIRPVPTMPEPPTWEIYLRKAAVLLRLGKDEEARKYISEVTNNEISPVKAFDWLIWHLIALEAYSAAKKAFDVLDHGEIPQTQWYLYRGIIALFTENTEDALRDLHNVLKKDARNQCARRGLAIGYLLKKAYHRALGFYKKLILDGVMEYDVITGGLFSSIMRNCQNIEIFVKALQRYACFKGVPTKNLEGGNTCEGNFEPIRNLLLIVLQQAKGIKQPKTLCFTRLILKAIKKDLPPIENL